MYAPYFKSHRKYFIIIFLLFSTFILPIYAQKKLIGIVVDSRGIPIEGALISIPNTSYASELTDSSGFFSIIVPNKNKCKLRVSSFGYISQTQAIKADTTKFILQDDLVGIETIVVTATRTPKTLKDIPVPTRVISFQDIQKADATNIADLLQTELSGIEFSYSMLQQTALNMSGFGGNSVLFLVDGERLAGETLDNIDYNRLTLSGIDHVEIVKGAASALYGSNAVGGVVNLISNNSQEPWTTNVNARFGAYNEQRYGGSFGFNFGCCNSQTDIQHTRIDGYNLRNQGYYSDVDGNHTWNFRERLSFNLFKRLNLTVRAGYFFRQRDYSAEEKNRYRDFNGGLKADYKFNNTDKIEFAYAYDQYDKSDYLPLSNNEFRDYSNVQHSFRTLYNHSFTTISTLTLGGDFMRDYLLSYQFANGNNYKQYIADCFMQFDWNPIQSLTLLTALRYDYFSEASTHSRFTPRINIMYKPMSNIALRGSYSAGFRAPTLKEMYMNYNIPGIFTIYGNEKLKSETSHNFSLSAEYFQQLFSFTLTGFYNHVTNRINSAWDVERDGLCYVNDRIVRIAGVETDARFKTNFGIGARLTYTYTYEHLPRLQPYVTTTRPHTAVLRIDYDHNWPRFGFNIALNGRVLSQVNADEYVSYSTFETHTVTYERYSIWRLMITARPLKGINITLSADNLFGYEPNYYFNSSPPTRGTTLSAGISIDIDKLVKN